MYVLALFEDTPESMSSLLYSAGLAISTKSSLCIVYHYDKPAAFSEISGVNTYWDNIENRVLERIKVLQDEMEHVFGEKIEIISEAFNGGIEDGLHSLKEKYMPLCIIIGLNRRNTLADKIDEHRKVGIINSVDVPILYIPIGFHYKQPLKCLYACDYKELDNSLPAHKIGEIISKVQGSLVVIHIDSDHNSDSEEMKEGDVLINKWIEDVKIAFVRVKGTDTTEAVLQYAEENNFDMIITTPRSHSFFNGLVQKPHTKDFIHSTKMPLLCVHA